MRRASASASRHRIERQAYRTGGARGDRQQEVVGVVVLRRDHEDRRPPELGQGEPAVGMPFAQCARGDVDLSQDLTGRQDVGVVPGDEIGRVDDALGSIGCAQGVSGLERHRHGDHRTRGQGHTDVAADRRGVPHLERGQERFAARREQGSGQPIGGRARMRTGRGSCTSRRSRARNHRPSGCPSPVASGRSAAANSVAGRRTARCRPREMRLRPASAPRADQVAAGPLGDGVEVQIWSPLGINGMGASHPRRSA